MLHCTCMHALTRWSHWPVSLAFERWRNFVHQRRSEHLALLHDRSQCLRLALHSWRLFTTLQSIRAENARLAVSWERSELHHCTIAVVQCGDHDGHPTKVQPDAAAHRRRRRPPPPPPRPRHIVLVKSVLGSCRAQHYEGIMRCILPCAFLNSCADMRPFLLSYLQAPLNAACCSCGTTACSSVWLTV